MKKKKKKPITAADRTPSLFTGKTDLEHPDARDGSKPDYSRPLPGKRTRASGYKYKPGPVSQTDRNR